MQIDKMNAIDDVVFSQKNISVEPKPNPWFLPTVHRGAMSHFAPWSVNRFFQAIINFSLWIQLQRTTHLYFMRKISPKAFYFVL